MMLCMTHGSKLHVVATELSEQVDGVRTCDDCQKECDDERLSISLVPNHQIHEHLQTICHLWQFRAKYRRTYSTCFQLLYSVEHF